MTDKKELTWGEAIARVAVLEAELAELRKRVCVPEGLRECAIVMRGLSLCETEEITSDDAEIWLEDENGRDGSYLFSITEYAGKCAEVLEAMLAAAPAPVERVEQQGEWERCQSIADCPQVDAVLQAFADDPTGDQGVMIVREVLRAGTPERPLQCHECADRVALEAGAKAISDQFLAALRRLTFAARTTGGTAGPDAELIAACEQAEHAISIAGAGRAFTEAVERVEQEPGLYAVHFIDNWDGERDCYWLIARLDSKGQWLSEESGKALLQYEGDTILAAIRLDAPQPAPTAAQDVAGLRDAYMKMRNVAAGYSNLCEADSANARRLEKEFDAADEMYRSAAAHQSGGAKRCHHNAMS